MIVTKKTLEEFVYVHKLRSYSQYISDADWSKDADQGKYDFELQEDDRRASITSSYDFTNTDSLQEAIELATSGWKEGIKKIKQKYDVSKKTQSSFVVDPRNNVYGSYVNIGRYLEGMPDCMVDNVVLMIPKRINIICKVGFNSSASESDFIKYGTKILQLIDELESKNIRVNLEIRWCIHSSGKYYVDRIILKNYNDFVNLNILCFALCHPSFERRIGFSVVEKQSEDIVRYFGFSEGYGYGSIAELIVTEEEKKNSLCIDSGSSFEFDYDKFVIE